jgi:uncharacterized repeat protein (TIGR03803 family)
MNKFSVLKKACILSLFLAATAVALPAPPRAPGISSPRPIFTTVHNFGVADGFAPYARLVQGSGGALYGTTSGGGTNYDGTVFGLNIRGTLTTVHSFDGTDGAVPFAGLIQGTDGKFYGTTYYGGANGNGTVFSIASNAALTTLYNFCSQSDCPDGYFPQGELVQGTDGKFYGTTESGGANRGGTVFSITSTGTLTTLYSFCSQSECTDGAYPFVGLIQGTDGKFYGTTYGGGTSDSCSYRCGTVFSVTAGGALTTLHSFEHMDGQYPEAALVQAADGKFYGTTYGGGTNGEGTVFRITVNGKLATLYSFCSQYVHQKCLDGAGPTSSLTLAGNGKLYGTAQFGGGTDCRTIAGTEGCGTIFQITQSGTLTTLYTFCLQRTCTDGAQPYAGLVQDTDGVFYGTTQYGGECGDPGCGTVFSLSVGLGPFVRTNPATGKVGANVGILGPDLTGATSVTFNGTQTAFRVVSKTFIEAKVPSGATTGTVQVKLPSGTLFSNVPFVVLN